MSTSLRPKPLRKGRAEGWGEDTAHISDYQDTEKKEKRKQIVPYQSTSIKRFYLNGWSRNKIHP